MNLAFCLFKYFPYGGLQRDFVRIAEECVRRGHKVDVYTMSWEGEQNNKFNIKIIPAKGLQNHTRIKNFAEKIQSQLKNYDLVIGFNKMPGLDAYYAADTCFQAKTRQQHGSWYQLMPRYRALKELENSVFSENFRTHILLISPLQQKEFEHYYHTSSDRFHLLPPGIAKDRIAPDNAQEIRKKFREEHRISENEFLLLMIGSGFKTKGLDRILTGIASLPDDLKKRSRLYIIGKDHSEPFQRQAQKLGISGKITFLGGRDDIPRFLLGADLLLHPAYNENTGTVLLEALVSGLPVLTTDVCGYAEYIEKAQAGMVLPSPFQQNQFNQMLKNMLLSPDRPVWRHNALAFSQMADIYSLPERAVDIIESLGHKRVLLSTS